MAKQIAIRDAFGAALKKLGEVNEHVVALEADVGNSSKSILFGQAFPERYFNVGIAELNMTSMAAGMALSGMIPFVNTFATFLTSRALDPVISLIAYDHLNVKLCGTYSGLSDSYDGASHHSICDLSAVRSLPGMTVISVCDAVETEKAVFAAAELDGPVYLRLSRAPAPVIYPEDMDFKVGKGIVLREGSDIAILATGYMVHKALKAAELLEEKGIFARVADIHAISPIDRELLLESAKKCGKIITVEEHSISGGLGSAVCEVLSETCPVPVKRLGLTDYSESGDYEEILEKAGLSAACIAEKAEEMIKGN